jgi:hypothetical protein
VFPVFFDGGEHVYRAYPINVQLVTYPVIMLAKEEDGCDSGSESIDKHEPRDILHFHVERRDQSLFSLRFSHGLYRVYRRRGERFTDQSVYETDRFGCVIVWAGICHDGRTQLKIVQGKLNAVKYRKDILDPIVLLFPVSYTDWSVKRSPRLRYTR